ncbi:MAG: hypothetical protein KDC13_06795 [Bacteroidetes bacterium]|nr:hypothetical protein [Bacteroidota bacterium]
MKKNLLILALAVFFCSCGLEQTLISDFDSSLIYVCARHNKVSVEQLFIYESVHFDVAEYPVAIFNPGCPYDIGEFEPLLNTLREKCKDLNITAPVISSSEKQGFNMLNNIQHYETGRHYNSGKRCNELFLFWNEKRINAYRKLIYSARLWRDRNTKKPIKIIPVYLSVKTGKL